jgi:5-methylcytosine-specific restriction protein A
MPTYLLTWKPRRWDWKSLGEEIRSLNANGPVRIRWSAGNNQRIRNGDRVFLLRQGSDRPGIIGAGRVIKGSYRARHWDPSRSDEDAIYVDIRMDSLLHAEQDPILRRDELNFGPKRIWISQSSGVTIPEETAKELERRWLAHLRKVKRAPLTLPDEIIAERGFPDGAKQRVTVNRYERDPRNRAGCIAIHGHRCVICGFEFGRVYGELGRNFIHVHHIVSLATLKGRPRKPNPRRDLRPICPNCHAMVHIGRQNRTIREMQRIVSATKRGS